MFSFIHTADLHLDSPFIGLGEIDEKVNAVLYRATFDAFKNIVTTCIDRKVDFLIVSGDVYDGADRNLHAQLKFRDQLKRLSEAGIASFIAHGNHDPLNGWAASLEWPKGVHIFDSSVQSITFRKDGVPVAEIYGISHSQKNVKTNLSEKFKVKDNTLFKIGVLHCNAGAQAGHENYAPCTLENLTSTGIDYWALGHIHEKKILHKQSPVIAYSGNPQGRHIRESGPRGCYLVQVDNDVVMEEISVDVVRWLELKVNIESLVDEDELIKLIEEKIEKLRKGIDGRNLICRVIFTGRSSLHKKLNRPGMLDGLTLHFREQGMEEIPFVWIEKMILKTKSEINKKDLVESQDMVGEVLKLTYGYHEGKNDLQVLKSSLASLYENTRAGRYLDELNDDELLVLLDEAEDLCLENLLSGE